MSRIRSVIACAVLALGTVTVGAATADRASADSCTTIGSAGTMSLHGTVLGHVYQIYCSGSRTVHGRWIADGTVTGPFSVDVYVQGPTGAQQWSGWTGSGYLDGPSMSIDAVPNQYDKTFTANIKIVAGSCNGAYSSSSWHNYANGADSNMSGFARC
ncbi:hypothetical protein ACFYNO_35835 [Kitasatospora sp. NPDC006697]|uniref:hypothetical protein n=1 Tax=Kitasatospora sp. NPDC006697 TaxID=3364020 RepID=UPI0036859A08